MSYSRMVGFSSSSWYIRVNFVFTPGGSQALRVHSRFEMYPALVLKMEVYWHVQWLMSNDPGLVVAMNLVPLAAVTDRSYVQNIEGLDVLPWCDLNMKKQIFQVLFNCPWLEFCWNHWVEIIKEFSVSQCDLPWTINTYNIPDLLSYISYKPHFVSSVRI